MSSYYLFKIQFRLPEGEQSKPNEGDVLTDVGGIMSPSRGAGATATSLG